MIERPPPEILDALRRMGLLATSADAHGERLTGGVSSDIWRIDLPAGPVCVKRALAKLRVAADWQAPVERNRYEARWMQRANAAVPGAAPQLLGSGRSDRHAGDAVPAAEPLSAVEDATARRRRRPGFRRPGCRCAGAHPCRHCCRLLPPQQTSPPIGSSTTFVWSPIWSRPAARIPTSRRQLHCLVSRRPRPTSTRWCTAMSVRRTSCAARPVRCSSTPSAPGGAIRRSISRSASTTCC